MTPRCCQPCQKALRVIQTYIDAVKKDLQCYPQTSWPDSAKPTEAELWMLETVKRAIEGE